jgi:hypothetical protein
MLTRIMPGVARTSCPHSLSLERQRYPELKPMATARTWGPVERWREFDIQ